MCLVSALYSGIGLETAILFAKEGARVMMADISVPALERALAKVKQLVPDAAPRVETMVSSHCLPCRGKLLYGFLGPRSPSRTSRTTHLTND